MTLVLIGCSLALAGPPAGKEEYHVIPAAKPGELTPALPGKPDGYRSWSRSHGDAGSTRYSALNQINRENVRNLEVAWTYRSKDGVGNIQSNPVVVDGVLYAPTSGDHVVALNAETGKEIWRFKPEGKPALRGLIYWAGSARKGSRIYFPAGGFLYSLNAKTGQPVYEFGIKGRVKAGGVVAPAIYQDVIVVPAGNEVYGVNVVSGERLWTFHVIPRPGEFGHGRWDDEEKGANIWGGMAMDVDRGIAYLAVGAPHANFIGVDHPGRNLFANCVLALDAKTGKRLWHFQEIRHDIWDLDIAAPPVLVTVTREGKRVDAVAQVTKLGNTLLLDRVTGKPLFPFRLRAAPASHLPGEETWPYQPAAELPEPFARQEFTLNEVTNLSQESRDSVLQQLKNANYGWFAPFTDGKPTAFFGIHGGAEWTGAAFDPATGWLYVSSNEVPWIVTVSRLKTVATASGTSTDGNGQKVYQTYCAGCHGKDRAGRGMAPPLLNLAERYQEANLTHLIRTGKNAMPGFSSLPDSQMKDLRRFLLHREQPATSTGKPRYTYNGYPKLLDKDGYPGSRPPWGTLNAIDLNNGRIAWKVPLGEYEELTRKGIPKTGTENFGGAIVTGGGLVFCAGTRDLKIRAFDKRTGEELWAHKLPFGGYAPPASYEVNGRQYVVIAATGGGKLGGEMGDAYVAFALPQ